MRSAHECRICAIGEGMMELSGPTGDQRLAYGGDAINTAVHLARCGRDVRFASALGDDPYSAGLRAAWERESVSTELVIEAPGRLPGLYAIRTDEAGERTFHYWRGESAARAMFEAPGSATMIEAAADCDLFYFSLISLAILDAAGRDRLIAIAEKVRANGGRVAFDGNYRARLWPDHATARAVRDRALAVADIGLPTLADEIEMGAAGGAEAVAAHWRAAGVGETIVKLGSAGCLVDGAIVPPPPCATVRDTSGAGDAFNAGYLHARLAGLSAAHAALSGHRLAGWVIERPGAIPDLAADAPYAVLIGAAGR
ncbi:MAG: sugar kinase [Sphingomonas sp.]